MKKTNHIKIYLKGLALGSLLLSANIVCAIPLAPGHASLPSTVGSSRGPTPAQAAIVSKPVFTSQRVYAPTPPPVTLSAASISTVSQTSNDLVSGTGMVVNTNEGETLQNLNSPIGSGGNTLQQQKKQLLQQEAQR